MSIYKNFRNYGERVAGFNTLSKRFDQPTYLTFRIEFAGDSDAWYNAAAGGGLNYDRMPHPLFGVRGNDDVNLRETYSAIDYLLDANEFTRAKMLEEFIVKFKTLQTEYQYYFQELQGVDELLKVNTKRGQRISSDTRLVIKMLEGIDLRVSHLMNLYRKIAWDDTYQRWVLPDMMRYFTLKIYISEFRTFHTPNQYNGMGVADSTYKEEGQLFLNLLDDVFPSWVINCEMCEFDIENTTFDYLGNLSVTNDPQEAEVSMSIKVGKIYEEQVYPIFRNMYLIDKLINGFARSQSREIDNLEVENQFGSYTVANTKEFDSTENAPNSKSRYGSNFEIAQDTYNQALQHESGKYFNGWQSVVKWSGAGEDKTPGTADDVFTEISPSPTEPNTWIGNAFTFGKAFATNFAKELIDKGKITPIPGLGFSFAEATSAIESKDIITGLGLIRKSVNRVTETDRGYPGDHLGDTITDTAFRAFLTGVTMSTATTDIQIKMQEAAGVALSDEGVWQKIKDFSKATNLVGTNTGEVNTEQTIQGKDFYKNIADQESIKQPLPIQRIIMEGVPTSAATNGQLIKG